jgi:acetyl-CoA acetyltransferase
LSRRTRTSKSPDDIVITLAIRTPLCKGKKGGFKDTTTEYLMYAILKATRERMGFSADLVEDICMGNVRFRTILDLSQTKHEY